MKGLFKYLKKYSLNISVAVLFAILASVLSVMLPSFVSSITKEIQNGLSGEMRMDDIARYTVLALVFVVATFLLGYYQSRIMAGVSVRVTKKLRMDLNDKLDRLPTTYFDGILSGDVVSRVTNDVDLLTDALAGPLVNILSNTVLLLGCIIMMFITNPILAATVMLSTFIGLFVALAFIKKGKPMFAKQQAELGILNGMIDEDLTGHLVIKAFNSEELVDSVFEEQNERLHDHAWKASFFSGMLSPLAIFCGNLSYVAVCILGAALVIGNVAGTGLPSIVAFILYAKMFSTPLTQMSSAFSKIQAGIAGADRIFSLLREDEMAMPVDADSVGEDTSSNEEVKGNVVFSHVTFGYQKDRPVIRDFSKNVEAGRKIAIVGETGAGKSTLVNLLMRYYEIDGGTITIDGEDITEIDRKDLHKKMAIVPQDTWMFEGTLRDNIVYSTKNVTDEMLLKAIDACGLTHFVMSLPEGMDTVLSEHSSISAGQKQLVTIARAMVKNASILILDEATSSVDTRSEIMIQNALDALTRGRTSFVIAHRLSTIKNADEIFVLKDGDIAETGTHKELLASNGVYAELYNSQFDY